MIPSLLLGCSAPFEPVLNDVELERVVRNEEAELQTS